jgi:UDP-N-acetylmuramoylalanine--D-glutamate ligase
MKRVWDGQRVVIIGAARQGIALARYLVRQGAKVVLTDRRPIEALLDAREALDGQAVDWVAGGHPMSLLDRADLVCPSGGVPLSLPLVLEARRRGIPLSNDSQVFLEAAPCRVIGITGSAGKTTTTTLVGRIAAAGVKNARVWVGGNIGSPLISVLEDMQADDLAIMELSSFQLELMNRSPQVAAVLNVTPNHLDRHSTMEAYSSAKARILEFQHPEDTAVLGRDDPGAWRFVDRIRGQLISFGIAELPPGQTGITLHEDGETIVLRRNFNGEEQEVCLMSRRDIALRGEHNLLNVFAACAIGYAAGLAPEAMQIGVAGFGGVPHRLEFVRSWGGADWYNDSIATAPERAMAAIRAFNEPLVLLAGGRDKDLPWEDFARLVGERVDHLILFGEAAGKILQAIQAAPLRSKTELIRCGNLHDAIRAAAGVVSTGDVVLLAPGGTSFDEFRDFEDRGEAYRKWVMELP